MASANKDATVTKSFAAATAQAFKVAQDRDASNVDSLSTAMAAASVRAAAVDGQAAARALAALASQVLSAGVQEAYARSQALAFSASRQQGNIGSYARTVASAIHDGGHSATQVYGSVFAKAIAAGGSQAAALAGQRSVSCHDIHRLLLNTVANNSTVEDVLEAAIDMVGLRTQ